jgi:predicted RNA polymerase sigma factor
MSAAREDASLRRSRESGFAGAAPVAPRQFLATAAALAGELSAEARAALVATWPADGPPPAVVAHLLSVMLADTHAQMSAGFVRRRAMTAKTPPKPPKPDMP